MNKKRYRIGHIFISMTNPQDTQKTIIQLASQGQGGYICVSNMRMVMYADSHPQYAQLMHDSTMNLPDGTPLVWCARFWGMRNVDKTCGPDLFMAMLSSRNEDLKHYLLGDTSDVIEAIINKYKAEGANIVGGESLPFANVEEFDYMSIAERVKKSGANIVWTAMRAPKQDEFNKKLFEHLPNVICIGVGRAFRISIGEVNNAPQWAIRMGLGGLFMLRRSIFIESFWYIAALLKLIEYFLQIKTRRLLGKKSFE